ncbi:hypothetical protein EB230_31055 [Mesorhizobium sp. NZP2234]|nr:hypothetical protein EB230_31055 [Mesorhizobium sp. NZP2234]
MNGSNPAFEAGNSEPSIWLSAHCLITDLQSQHFVDEKGALFPGRPFLRIVTRLAQARWIPGNCEVDRSLHARTA